MNILDLAPRGINFYIIVNQEKKAPSTSEESKLFEDKLK
jgi:hypothetical protein